MPEKPVMDYDKNDFYLTGRKLLREGDYGEAIDQFEKVLNNNPQHRDAAFYIAVAWEKQEELLMAQLAYQKVIKIDPSFKKAWEKLYELYDRMRNWEDFHGFYESLYPTIDKTGLKFWLLEKVAITYLTEKKLNRAEESYRELLRLKPGYTVALLNLAKVYQLGERQDDKALEILMRAFELDNNDTSLVLYMARLLRKLNRKDEMAMKVYRTAFRLDPSDHGNNLYLKNLFMERDEISEPSAIKLYDYFINQGEKEGELFFHRGLIWKKKNNWEQAVKDFQRSVELNFSQEEHYPEYELSYCFYKLYNYRLCKEQLKLHLDKWPDHINGWKLARKVFFSKDFEWSEKDDFLLAEKIAFRFPSDQLYLKLAGYARNNLKDLDRAEKLYVKALEINHNLLSALEALEVLYEEQKNWGALSGIYTSQLYQFLSKKDKRIYYLYKMADLNWRRLMDYSKAEELFFEILKLDPKQKKVYLEMANLARSKKDFGAAKTHLRNLLLKDISNENIYSMFASVFLEEGKIRMASQAYGIWRLLVPEDKSVKEFFSGYSFPAIREAMQWERENEELLIHKNEKDLIAFLSWSRIWCEKLYAPQISDEVLRNASLTSNSHRTDIKDMVFWCSKRIGLGEIPSYVYYGKKSTFSIISCFSASGDSYIIFHEDFLSLLDERETLFLIAHELAHIKKEHHLYYRIKERVINWTLGLTSNLLFSKLPIPVPSIWKNWTLSKDLEGMDFDVALLGLDFTADRYGLFFCGDVESASRAIWKKNVFSKKRETEKIDLKRLLSSHVPGISLRRDDKEIALRISELWAFAMSYEYEVELTPIILFGTESH